MAKKNAENASDEPQLSLFSSIRHRIKSESYIGRQLDAELEILLQDVPAIGIEGPRGVGKTTTALEFAKTVFRLDNDGDLTSVLANPDQLVDAPEPILIDEWQRYPASWDLVRRSVDADYRPGRFILTGSAAPANPPTHTGAGRIVTVRMRPMSLAERWAGEHEPTVSLATLLNTGSAKNLPEISGTTEVVHADYINEIIAGGFPAMRRGSMRAARSLMTGYCNRIIDTEFSLMDFVVRNPPALRRWMLAYAAATSTTSSYETIRSAAVNNEGAVPAKNTVALYADTLEKMWLLDPLPAWWPTSNQISRLAKASKHHLADPAIAANLLRANAQVLLAGKQVGPPGLRDPGLAGRLFESLIALNLRVYAQAADATVYHFRSRAGEHEVDFVIERDDFKVMAIEVKFKQVPSEDDFRHLRWLKEEIGDELVDAVMITTGTRAYRRLKQDNIAVVPAALLGP